MDRTNIANSDHKEVIFQNNKHLSITPNDDYDNVPNCPIFIGIGGDITLLFEQDKDGEELLYSVPNGFVFSGRIRRVLSTGTDCDQIRAWYIQ